MRITKINGVMNWPMNISCKHCEIEIEISMPSDMRIRREFKKKLIEDTPAFSIERTMITFQCPICGKIHEIDKDKIPGPILGKIPFEDIMPY